MTQTSKQLEAQLAILNEQIAIAKKQETQAKASSTRIHRPTEEKIALISQTFGNKTITEVAKANGVSPKLLGKWRLAAIRALDRKNAA